jgi:hypothetical protein
MLAQQIPGMPDIGGIVGGSLALTVGIILLSICFTIVLVWFILRVVRNASGGDKATQKLLQTGMPAQARIVQVQQTGMTINDNPVVNILLEVYPQNGQPPFQAWSKKMVSLFQISQYQVGAFIPVRFDPSDPSKVAIAI